MSRAFRDRHLAGLAVALCAVWAISACSVVAPRYFAGSSTPGVTAKQHPPASGLPTVAHPWHSGMPQLGIDVNWLGNSRDSDAVIRAKAERIIGYAIGLNANSIALTFPFYTYGITSDTVYADKVITPSPQHIAIFLAVARESRIRVSVRPLLNEDVLVRQNPIAWRGSIQPASPSAWFASYQKLLRPYAQVAESGHAATFIIGAELRSLQGAVQWPALVHAIGSVYHGELAYDENFDSFQNHDTSLPLSDFGVDAYPRFQLPDSASVSELTRAWENWLGTHSRTVLRKVVLSEVGITATHAAYQAPGNWLGSAHAAIVPRIQANWYAAACHAFAAGKLAGIYWWEVSFDADPAHPAAFLSDRLTFLERPAQQEVASCFASLTAAGNGES